jgi:L-amino acid N-acyltransferase YncA
MTTVDPPAAAVAATAVRTFRDWSALPDPPQRRWRVLASRHGLPEFSVDVLRRHKILLPFLQVVAARDDAAPGEWARELTRQRRRAAVLTDELRTVGRRLDACDVFYAVLRGPALARCYPVGWPREANDIDVLLRDISMLAEATAALTGDGYFVARPVICRHDPATGGVWAAAALNKLRPDLDHPVYVDLAVGGPAVNRTRAVPMTGEAWSAVERIPAADITIPVFAATDLAVLLAVELMERETVVSRDLLDYLAVAAQPVDWSAVRDLVRRHRLNRGLRLLAALARDAGLPETADQLHWLAAEPAEGRPGWRERLLRGGDGAYRLAIRSTPRLTLAAVEHLPTTAWFRAGLPVYAYPPRPDGTPLRGAAGAAAASLPGYRARIRPIAHAEEVEEIFERTAPDRYASLTNLELDWWQDTLCLQTVSAAEPEPVDQAHIRSYVHETIVADGQTAGTIAVRDDAAVVAACRIAECRHPLTLRPDLRVEGLCADAHRSDAVSDLLEQIPTGLETRTELPVRGTAAALRQPLEQHGFQPEVLVIRRPTQGLASEPDWQIRAATERDRQFVHDCLATAVRRGLLVQEPKVDVDAWVRRRFAELTGPHIECVVAESGSQVVGHGYATLRPDRYRPELCGYVVDVFVLPAAQGRGCSRALTAALGARLHERGVSILESEVVLVSGTADPAGLRASLGRAGWREDRMRWVRRS